MMFIAYLICGLLAYEFWGHDRAASIACGIFAAAILNLACDLWDLKRRVNELERRPAEPPAAPLPSSPVDRAPSRN